MYFILIFLANNTATSIGPDWVQWGVIITACAIFVTIIIFILAKAFGLNTKVTRVETKVDTLTDTINKFGDNLESFKLVIFEKLLTRTSPMQLTDEGLKIAKESGIDKLVEEYFELILEKVREVEPSNTYRAQVKILEVVKGLQYDDECRNTIETGAFETGFPIDTIYIIGGYYIRDRILDKLGFDKEEIDKYDPEKKKKKNK